MNKTTVIQAATFIVTLLTLFVALFAFLLVRQYQEVKPQVKYVTRDVVVTPVASASPVLKSATTTGVFKPALRK